jgi:hypothetical protein
MSNIEWTDATWPCYHRGHGADAGWCDQDRGGESGNDGRGVQSAARSGREVVHPASALARDVSVRNGRNALRRFDGIVSRGPERATARRVHAEGTARPRPIVRPAARRRPTPSAAAHQFLRGEGPPAVTERPAMRGLRTRVATGEAAA